MSQPSVTDEEIKTASRILAKLQPGFLPLDIFLQVTRLSVSSVIEVVPLRLHNGRTQVLLLQRAADDPYFPNMWHTPGVIVLATDEAGRHDDAFERILHGELQSVEVADKPEYVTSILHKSRRGMEDAKVYFVEITGEPTVGRFYDIDALPGNLVETQASFIHSAAHALLREHEKAAAAV